MSSADWTETLRRLETAKGDPKTLALMTVDLVVGQQNPMLLPVLEVAAVPHWFTEATLRQLMDDHAFPESDRWFEELTHLSMVERFHAHAGWNVHEVTRLAIRERFASEHPVRFRAISTRLAWLMAGEDDHSLAIEGVYHLLCGDDAETGARELRRLWKDWIRAGRPQPLQALAKNLDELRGFVHLAPKGRAYALVAIAEIQENRFDLPTRESLARKSLDLLGAAGDDLGTVDAATVLGRVLTDYGRLAEALAVYERAAALLASPSSVDIDSADISDRRADLGRSKGRTLRARGLVREALTEYEGVLAFCTRLSEQFPDDLPRRHELAVAHADLGDALNGTSRLAEAESHFVVALQIARSCVSPVSPVFGYGYIEQGIAQLLIRLGDLLSDRGRLADALDQFEGARKISATLMIGDPEHSDYEGDLAQSYGRLGGLDYARKELDAAEENWTNARKIFTRLNQRDPSNPLWKQQLAQVSSQFGKLRWSQERLLDALHEFQDAERLSRGLLESDPDRAQWHIDLSTAQNQLVEIANTVLNALIDSDDETKASVIYGMINNIVAASKTVKALVERDSGNVIWRYAMASTERLLASALETVARHVEAGLKLELEVSLAALNNSALERYASSVTIFRQLINHSPDNTAYKVGFSRSAVDTGRLLVRMDNRKDALQAYQAALAATQDLIELDSENKFYVAHLASIEQAINGLQSARSITM